MPPMGRFCFCCGYKHPIWWSTWLSLFMLSPHLWNIHQGSVDTTILVYSQLNSCFHCLVVKTHAFQQPGCHPLDSFSLPLTCQDDLSNQENSFPLIWPSYSLQHISCGAAASAPHLSLSFSIYCVWLRRHPLFHWMTQGPSWTASLVLHLYCPSSHSALLSTGPKPPVWFCIPSLYRFFFCVWSVIPT